MDQDVVGKPVPRVDAWDKVTGQAAFTTDLRLPRMLYGKILRSPYSHARILNIDVSKAKALSGVWAVIGAEDTPRNKVGAVKADEYILALDKVRYVGDEVAAVAAESEELAEEALGLIKVDYQQLPAVFDSRQAMMPEAPQIHDGGNLASQFEYERGDVSQGFRESELVLEGSYQTGMSHQSYMEPRGCVAAPDSSGRVAIWGGFSAIFRIRKAVAAALSLDENKVRVIQPYCGGSFGGKGSSSKAPVAALLALLTSRPVKIINSRAEEFQAGRPRIGTIIEQKVGAMKDGRLVAREVKVIADCGAYLGFAGHIAETVPFRSNGVYRFSHLKAEGFVVYTNKTPVGPCRGFGNPQGTFALETLLDELAETLGMDPLELRLKNIYRAGETNLHGWKMTSTGLKECLERTAATSGWKEKRARKVPGRGLGLACAVHNSGNRMLFNFDGSSAFVKIDGDGSVTLITGESDTGQGAWSVMAQMVAEELGIPLDYVKVPRGDTDVAPFCLGAYAGRVTVIGGSAARAAASDAKRQLFQVVASLLEANPEDLEAKGGEIFVRGSPARSVSFAEASRAAIFRQDGGPILGRGVYDPPTYFEGKKTMYGHFSPNYPFCAEVVELEVDRDTGQVKVISVAAADDIGRAINPLAVESQIQGCISQGLGFALNEEMVFDKGNLVNPNFMDYKVACAPDLPEIEPILVESNDPVGPYGAKAASETALIPLAAAVANAIYDAVGIRVKSLPITPEKILNALREKEGGNTE